MTFGGMGLPLAALAIVAVVVVFFVIKSLVKIAVLGGLAAGVAYLVWRIELWDYVVPYIPWLGLAGAAG